MKKVRLLEIFLVFLKVGSMIFGSGIVVLPILEVEAVQKRNWLTSEELVEYYAISQLIPGINAPDVSMFIGYKLRGKGGAIAAGTGIILIPFLLIICIATLLNTLIHISLVKSILWGIEIGTIIILITAIKTMWERSIIDKFSFGFGLVVFCLIAFTNISPVWIVFVALILGFVKGFLIKEREKLKE